jgi:hypothetical protein
MNKYLASLSLATAILLTGCNGSDSDDDGNITAILEDTLAETIADMLISELSAEEEESLLFVREEEKLARDVYLALDDKWGTQTEVFSTIAESENIHTDAVKILIEKYSLEDPVSENSEKGVFQNDTLQNLYTNLVEQGSNSLEDALIVGATIEDLDISDLEKDMEIIDNEDILLVYSNLVDGSESHMRAFLQGLDSYDPQYISVERYEEIMSEEAGNTGGNTEAGNTETEAVSNSNTGGNIETGNIETGNTEAEAVSNSNTGGNIEAGNTEAGNTEAEAVSNSNTGGNIEAGNTEAGNTETEAVSNSNTGGNIEAGNTEAGNTEAEAVSNSNTGGNIEAGNTEAGNTEAEAVSNSNTGGNIEAGNTEAGNTETEAVSNSNTGGNIEAGNTEAGNTEAEAVSNSNIGGNIAVQDQNHTFVDENGTVRVDGASMIADIPLSELSAEETASLLFIREEEKLARDVYYALDEIWGDEVAQFRNIVKAEQSHTDSVKALIERYGLEDPVSEDEDANLGIFQNEELQNIYTDLVEQGSKSIQDALTVGATIEDLDIYDIEREMEAIDNEDILLVYENLVFGSENHLRAFLKSLDSYAPQYISEERYAEIVSEEETVGGNGVQARNGQ